MPDDKLSKEQSAALAAEAEEAALRALSMAPTRRDNRSAIADERQLQQTDRKNAEAAAAAAVPPAERQEALYQELEARALAEDPAEAMRARLAEEQRQEYLRSRGL